MYPDENGHATGYLYQDDGFTFEYLKDKYTLYKFRYQSHGSKAELSIKHLHNEYQGQKTNWLVKVVGVDKVIEVEVTGTKVKFDIDLE